MRSSGDAVEPALDGADPVIAARDDAVAIDATAVPGHAVAIDAPAAIVAEGEADAFLDAFESLAQAIRRARGAPAQDATGRLTFSQYALIRALAGREAARVSDLAGDAEVTPSTATRILDALERRAMVRRTRSAEDRRGVTITLTERGRAALDRQDMWMRGRQRAFYEQLPVGEQALVPALLVRMATLIDELAAGPDD